jgi:hypothetical protein
LIRSTAPGAGRHAWREPGGRASGHKEVNRVQVRARSVAAFALAGLVVNAGRAGGQQLPATPDTTGSRVRLGPLQLNPSISLSNIGVDTNLFNEAEALNPQRDLALNLSPQTDAWMRLGRTWLVGDVRQDLVWFRDHRDERSANGTYRGGWLVPLSRVSVLVDGSWQRAKERTGFEIDTRASRREGAVTGALEVRALSRTLVGGRFERRTIRFSAGSIFGGEDLARQLNRTRTAATASIRYELTPITSLTTEVSQYRDRFAFSPDRDADSVQASAGFRLDQAAIIKGWVLVGYRRFSPVSADVPRYNGATVSANLSYVALTSTRVAVEGVRDVEYSYEMNQPYYLLNGVTAAVTQRVYGPFDVQGRVGYRTLVYRNRPGDGPASPRRDRVTTVGGGGGYRVGHDVRVSFDVEQQRRTSPLELRTYSGSRYGFSVTYGL